MSESQEWVRGCFARDKSKKRYQLANFLGIDKSGVTRMLTGERQIKADELSRIALFFGEPRPTGFSEVAAEFSPAPGLAPIFRATVEGGFWLVHRHKSPIDRRQRGPHFANAVSAFGFYAPDGSAAPRFKAGEILWADAARPPRPGDDALFVEAGGRKAPERVQVGELKSVTRGELVFSPYKDKEDRRLPARRWSALLLFPRS